MRTQNGAEAYLFGRGSTAFINITKSSGSIDDVHLDFDNLPSLCGGCVYQLEIAGWSSDDLVLVQLLENDWSLLDQQEGAFVFNEEGKQSTLKFIFQTRFQGTRERARLAIKLGSRMSFFTISKVDFNQTLFKGDIDANNIVNAADAISGLAAQVQSGYTGASSQSDVSGDGRVGLAEVIFALQKKLALDRFFNQHSFY